MIRRRRTLRRFDGAHQTFATRAALPLWAFSKWVTVSGLAPFSPPPRADRSHVTCGRSAGPDPSTFLVPRRVGCQHPTADRIGEEVTGTWHTSPWTRLGVPTVRVARHRNALFGAAPSPPWARRRFVNSCTCPGGNRAPRRITSVRPRPKLTAGLFSRASAGRGGRGNVDRRRRR